MTKRIIIQTCRWPVKQVAENVVEIHVPLSPDAPSAINPDFAAFHKMSESEVEDAEYKVLASIAWII